MRNGEELQRVGEEKNIVQATKRRKDNCIGHIFHPNYLLKYIIEGKKKTEE